MVLVVPITTIAVVVQIPEQNWDDDVAVTWPTTVQGSEKNIFVLIQQINEYLWFTIGLVCFGVVVYGWFTLMSASGNEDKQKLGSKILKWGLIGIIIAMVSYAAVRLIINLF